jgi:hemoglobin-like flavoprotein
MSEVAERLQRSLEILAADEPTLIRRVYEDLFEHHPQTAVLFSEHSRTVRAEMVREALMYVIDHSEGASWVEENLTSLGDQHEVNGVTLEMYGWFVDSLLRIFAEISGPQWSAELEGSWRTALELVSDLMCKPESGAAI